MHAVTSQDHQPVPRTLLSRLFAKTQTRKDRKRVGGAKPLAHLACDPSQSKGRVHPLAQNSAGLDQRDPFERDHDRVVHSRAFRKLQHKTQVFVASEIDAHRGDTFRTRLTHSIEVSQITRTICRQLGLNETLGATIALAHDLGHTPFGHTGEDALSEALVARGLPPFDHNDQTIRNVDLVERSYPQHPGLNLTWETLEGIAKHNGPVIGSVPPGIAALDQRFGAVGGLDLNGFASLEAQVAAVCDDIAYNSHDIDDGLRAGVITLDQLCEAVPLAGQWVTNFRAAYPDASLKQTGFEVIRKVISTLVFCVVAHSRLTAETLQLQRPDDCRTLTQPVVVIPQEVEAWLLPLRQFLFTEMYRHPSVMETRGLVGQMVADLYGRFEADPALLPEDWRARYHRQPERTGQSEVLVDYIAGMTDRYALATHARLCC